MLERKAAGGTSARPYSMRLPYIGAYIVAPGSKPKIAFQVAEREGLAPRPQLDLIPDDASLVATGPVMVDLNACLPTDIAGGCGEGRG